MLTSFPALGRPVLISLLHLHGDDALGRRRPECRYRRPPDVWTDANSQRQPCGSLVSTPMNIIHDIGDKADLYLRVLATTWSSSTRTSPIQSLSTTWKTFPPTHLYRIEPTPTSTLSTPASAYAPRYARARLCRCRCNSRPRTAAYSTLLRRYVH